MNPRNRGAVVSDRIVRAVLRVAYVIVERYPRLRVPRNGAVNVAVWWSDSVVLVRRSYAPGFTLPGGRLRRSEKPVEGACRELREETYLVAQPAQLRQQPEPCIFEYHPPDMPEPRADNREIVEAVLVSADRAVKLAPQFASYFRRRTHKRKA